MSQIDITRSSALFETALFALMLLAMQIFFIWKALTGGVSSVVGGLPAGFPDWGKWLLLIVLTVVLSWVCRRLTALRRVTLIGNRLWIQSWTKTVNVRITEVATVYWTQQPDDDTTPEAMIVLRESTALGREIRFEPRNAAAFDLLCSKARETSHEG